MDEAQGTYIHEYEIEEWMSIWALNEQTPMDMEKEGMKT